MLDALGRRRLPARAVPASRVWSMLPASYATMVLAVGIAGLGAGLAASAHAALSTPVMGGLLLLAAGQKLRSPLVGQAAPRASCRASWSGR